MSFSCDRGTAGSVRHPDTGSRLATVRSWAASCRQPGRLTAEVAVANAVRFAAGQPVRADLLFTDEAFGFHHVAATITHIDHDTLTLDVPLDQLGWKPGIGALMLAPV